MSLLHAVISRGPIILAEKGVSSEDASYSSGAHLGDSGFASSDCVLYLQLWRLSYPAYHLTVSIQIYLRPRVLRYPIGSKLTYAADEHLFHYIRDSNDVTVLCMADDSLGRRVPFGQAATS